MQSATLAISAIGLEKTYTTKKSKGGETIRAVKGIDLAVESGEIFGFLGPNGAGKSTTVRMLTTLLPISGGTATVCGVDVAKDPRKVRTIIGVALQEAGLDPRQTGRELLELHCGLFGMSLEEARARSREVLEVVGLAADADRRVEGFSGGMKRRLDLATALVHRPQVLFLDEPTTGLDPASRQDIWQEVRTINALGTTIFLTTQYLEEADALCGRLAIIDGGEIVREGSPRKLKADLKRKRKLSQTPSLDDVFLDATGKTKADKPDVSEVG